MHNTFYPFYRGPTPKKKVRPRKKGVNFIPGVDFSDHWSFWKKGYPAMMITDTAFYRYPHYHKNSDTYEKLNYEGMAALTKGLKHVLMKIAE